MPNIEVARAYGPSSSLCSHLAQPARPYAGRDVRGLDPFSGTGSMMPEQTSPSPALSVIAHVPWVGMVSRAAGSGRIFGSTTALGCESRVA